MIAAIDLGGTRTKFGLVDAGQVVTASHCPADAGGSIAHHLDTVLDHLQKLATRQGITLQDCQGLGLLSTGLVNNQDMRVLSTNGKYDDAVDFNFRVWARQCCDLDLRMDNDARGALIGEWRYGAGQRVNDLVMVTLGTGIGTAAVVAGRPLTGPHFSGGILGGHLLVRSGGRTCTCGGGGCLEAEASGWALPQLIREHPLRAHAAAGDTCAQAIWDHCLTLWGEALVSFIHLFDPSRIIIGGGVMNDPEPVLASFRQTVRQLAWAAPEQVEIVRAAHPDNAGLIGGAALFDLSDAASS